MSTPAAPVPALPHRASITRLISLIVLHCTATPSGRRLPGAAGSNGWSSSSRVIDGWHERRGFRRNPRWVARFNPLLRSIGYHYVVDLDGRIWPGRHLTEVGAHASGHNAASVGVCLVGGAEPDAQYSRAQWAALAELVRELAVHLEIPLQHVQGGGTGVCGHRDLSPEAGPDAQPMPPHAWLKTCPGFDVSAWLDAGLLPSDRHVFDLDPVR